MKKLYLLFIVLFSAFLLVGQSKKVSQMIESGKLKYQLNDYHGAIQDFDSAIANDSKYFDAYLERGNVKNKKLRYKEAIEDYSAALIMKPDNQKTLLKLGQTQMALMSYLESIESFNHLILLDAQNADAFYLRGLIHIHLNFHDKGCKDLSKAGELGDYKAYEMINEYCR